MIAINNICRVSQPIVETDEKYSKVRLIDGLDVLDALCPVSKSTGLRENVLTLLQKLINDPRKRVLLEQALQEIPSDNSDARLTDDEKIEFCMQRLESGTPAENDFYRDRIASIIGDLPKPVQEEVKKETIAFDKTDGEIIENV